MLNTTTFTWILRLISGGFLQHRSLSAIRVLTNYGNGYCPISKFQGNRFNCLALKSFKMLFKLEASRTTSQFRIVYMFWKVSKVYLDNQVLFLTGLPWTGSVMHAVSGGSYRHLTLHHSLPTPTHINPTVATLTQPELYSPNLYWLHLTKRMPSQGDGGWGRGVVWVDQTTLVTCLKSWSVATNWIYNW